MAKQEPINFEQSFSQLEALVHKLESGELSLEDSLKSFEQGVSLVRSCQTALSEAEQRVRILMQEGDGLATRDFDVQS
ncbi:exodeoxyribonuclease VII small subunit [Gynuella sp.]|uniref:exodeoxyribonuclease VII small subunit n=1 Tax=Gynuella sp. TaxID=2969146 RepID=UPI003D14DE9B